MNADESSVSQSRYFALMPVVLCMALIWPFGGGQKIHMVAGKDTPAAHGPITVEKGDNGQHKTGHQGARSGTAERLNPARKRVRSMGSAAGAESQESWRNNCR